MDKIDISTFKRDPDYIKSVTKNRDEFITTNKKLYVAFPAKYTDKDLATLDNTCSILGIVVIYDDDGKYGIFTIPGLIDIVPNEITDIEMDDEHYIRLTIEEGENLIENVNVIQNGDMVYVIFNMLVLQGKVPWYIGYKDLLNVFANIPKYTGSGVGKDIMPFELFVALNARSKDNLDLEFRNSLTSSKDLKTKDPAWVGLMNIYYSFRSTLGKIGGSYMKQGITVAMVKPEKEATEIENALRK